MRDLIRDWLADATVWSPPTYCRKVEAVCARVLIMRNGGLALEPSQLDAVGRKPASDGDSGSQRAEAESRIGGNPPGSRA